MAPKWTALAGSEGLGEGEGSQDGGAKTNLSTLEHPHQKGLDELFEGTKPILDWTDLGFRL